MRKTTIIRLLVVAVIVMALTINALFLLLKRQRIVIETQQHFIDQLLEQSCNKYH